MADQRASWARTHGEGLRVLTGTITSPTLARQINALQQRYPAMRWHQWEPVSRDSVRAGAKLAYGRAVEIVPHIDAADVIVALDSDLISSAPGHVRFARDLASRRNPTRATMSRIYAIEPTPSLIGVAADHRIIAAPDEIMRATAMLADLILRSAPVPSGAPPWLSYAADDLKAHPGRAFIHVGPHLPAELHALAHAMNEALGGRGHTFDVIEPVEANPIEQAASLQRPAARHAGGPGAKPDHHRRQSRLYRIRPGVRGCAAPRAIFADHRDWPE